MPKEVRLNDKMWFGKHQGITIKNILNVDRNFLDVLVAKGKITYHQNIIDYLKEDRDHKTSPRSYWRAPQEVDWGPIYIDSNISIDNVSTEEEIRGDPRGFSGPQTAVETTVTDNKTQQVGWEAGTGRPVVEEW
jgi:hypothetical protein